MKKAVITAIAIALITLTAAQSQGGICHVAENTKAAKTLDKSGAMVEVCQFTSPKESRLWGCDNKGHTVAEMGYFGYTLESVGKRVILKTYSLIDPDTVPAADVIIKNIETGEIIDILKDVSAKGHTYTFFIPEDGDYTICWKNDLGTVLSYARSDNGSILFPKKKMVYSRDYISDDSWKELTKNIDLKKALETYVPYPTHGENGNSIVDTEKIEELSEELMSSDSLPDRELCDQEKVTVFIDYIVNNIAFDGYRASQDESKSRANMAGDWTDPNNFTYTNHVGVCWDYSCYFVIMCRKQGIPAVELENDIHSIPAVYLNGEWIAIDFNDIVKYKCSTKDTDKDNWAIKDYSRWICEMGVPQFQDKFAVSYDCWDLSPIEWENPGFTG